MVQFQTLNFFSWISSIFVGFFKSSRFFLCHSVYKQKSFSAELVPDALKPVSLYTQNVYIFYFYNFKFIYQYYNFLHIHPRRVTVTSNLQLIFTKVYNFIQCML